MFECGPEAGRPGFHGSGRPASPTKKTSMYTIAAPIQLLTGKGYGVEELFLLREGKSAGLRTVYVDGLPVKRDVQKIPFRSAVQPVSGKELLLVKEGDRKKEQFWIWVYEGCLGGQAIEVNDKVIRCGHIYQAQQTEAWTGYTYARIMRIDVGQESEDASQ